MDQELLLLHSVYFHIKKVEINKNELTAEVYLKLIAKNENECFI